MTVQITTELIKELRDATGISVMQCRKALEEAEGDMEKALAILKKTSSDIALKKAGRSANDGRVMVKADGKKAVMVALHSETDFVAKNEDFIKVHSALVDKAFAEGVDKMKEEAKSMIDPLIQKTGENIQLGEVYEVKGEVLGNYVHNNKSAVVVSLEGGNPETAKDIAMHIAAMKPEYIFPTDINDDTRKTVAEIFQKEVDGIDKPEEIKKKMLDGKIATYFKEKTLLEQPFIKNPDESIAKVLESAGAKILEVKRYSI